VQQTIREGMQRLHKRSAEDLLCHDVMSWMDLLHQLDSRTRGPASGCPVVVMVEPTDDRKSEQLIPCILTYLTKTWGTYCCTRPLRVKLAWRERRNRTWEEVSSPKWLFLRLQSGRRYSCPDKPT
jgi:hypothetical protein